MTAEGAGVQPTASGDRARVLACERCGAPLEVGGRGGRVRCAYCGAENLWQARRPEPATVERPALRDLDESDRFALFRSQDPELPVPSSVSDLMVGRVLDPTKLDAAKREWLRARAECLAGTGAGTFDRLYALTLLWHEHASVRGMEPLRRRAILESALELAATRRQAVVLRAMLAADAVLADDAAGAERWLAGCEPDVDDLMSHSAVHVARALIATKAGKWQRVWALLGRRAGDVPLSVPDAALASWLIAHALEQTGHVEDAVTELVTAIERAGSGRHWFARAWRRAEALELCPTAREKARAADLWAPRDSESSGYRLVKFGVACVVGAAIGILAFGVFLDRWSWAPIGGIWAAIGAVQFGIGWRDVRRVRYLSARGSALRATVLATAHDVEPAEHSNRTTTSGSVRLALRIAVEARKPFVIQRKWPARFEPRLEPGSLLSVRVEDRYPGQALIQGSELW